MPKLKFDREMRLRLEKATKDDDVDAFMAFIPDYIYHFDVCGSRPIHFCVENRSYRCLKALLEAGVDVNLPEANYPDTSAEANRTKTPVMIAVIWGNLKMVQTLYEAGADLNLVPEGSKCPPPIVYAASVEMIRWLVDHGARVVTREVESWHEWEYDIPGPLDRAVRYKSMEALELLLSLGVDPRACSSQSLQWAIQNERFEAVDRLVRLGVDVNSWKRCQHSFSPMMEAFSMGALKAMELMVGAGGDIHMIPDPNPPIEGHDLIQSPIQGLADLVERHCTPGKFCCYDLKMSNEEARSLLARWRDPEYVRGLRELFRGGVIWAGVLLRRSDRLDRGTERAAGETSEDAKRWRGADGARALLGDFSVVPTEVLRLIMGRVWWRYRESYPA